MKLIEFDGKRLLRDIGISIPRGSFFAFNDALSVPGPGACYVKAQVLGGRRGRSGLVKRVDRPEDIPGAITDILLRLKETPCAGWLAEEDVPHEREYLAAMDIDRQEGLLRFTLSEQGGMDVQEGSSFVLQHPSDAALRDLPEGIRDIASKLGQAMVDHDLLHAEINPLAELADGSFMALDAKIETDDAAAFRHPEWEAFVSLPASGRERTSFERAYDAFRKEVGHRGTFGNMIELDGDLALILSGGGASLMALDAIARAGGKPANTCEFSGNPERDAVRRGAAILFKKPGIRGIWIAGSYANFTDIRETVMGMLEAIEDAGIRVPVVIRRDGPRRDEAEREARLWASQHGVPLLFHGGAVSFEASAKELMRLVAAS
jgi:succinyl-CoA synthetase beta subunit